MILRDLGIFCKVLILKSEITQSIPDKGVSDSRSFEREFFNSHSRFHQLSYAAEDLM